MKKTDLYKAVANHLCGRVVDLHFSTPHLAGVNGLAMKQNGQPVVYIQPGLPEGKELKTFLHECGHIAASSWKSIPESKSGDIKPIVLSANEWQIKMTVLHSFEKEAEQISAAWLEYATKKYDALVQINRKANFYNYGFYPGRSIESLLKILLEWKG